MRLATAIQSGLGAPEKHVKRVEAVESRGVLAVQFEPADSFAGAWFHVHLSARRVAAVYAEAGRLTPPIQAAFAWGEREASLCLLRVGRLSDPAYDVSRAARTFEVADSRRVTLAAIFIPEVMGSRNDSGYTSAWSLSGLKYERNVERVTADPTRGRLRLDLEVSGSDVSVTLSRYGVDIASGAGTVGGSVALTEANGSGVSGSCTVASDAADVADASVFSRWPDRIDVLRGTSDPPTVSVASIPWSGEEVVLWTEPADLPAGSVYYRLRSRSDTGEDGLSTSTLSAVIPGTPAAPAGLALDSGDAAEAVISFTPSATLGATHNAYAQLIGEDGIDWESPIAADEIGHTVTLPAMTGPGTARVVLRATCGGVEEKNADALSLEFNAAGAFVAPRPNTAAVQERGKVVSGLSVSVPVVYDPALEQGAGATVKLFARSDDGVSTYDYNDPEDSDTLASVGNGCKLATLSAVLPSAGWYCLRALAYTAAGVPSTAADCPEVSVYVSAADVPAPTAISLTVSRG